MSGIKVFFFLIFISTQLFAQEDARNLKLDASRPVKLNYKSEAWNKDSKKAETAALILRDTVSSRIVKIEMTETDENSGEFVGNYQINFSTDKQSAISLEVYVAPLAMIKADAQLKRIEALIKDGTLLRKPYFLRVEKGSQNIAIFDSREQTLLAYQNYLKNGAGKPLVDPAALEAQSQVEQKALEQLRIKLAADAEMNRQKMEEIEKRRQEELKAQAAKMSAEQKQKQKAQAKQLAEEALAHYQKNELKSAEEKFAKALDLDPETTGYSFQYGVTLYKNEKYNQSIVMLRMANGPEVNANERDYYQALAHMKLKEYEQGYDLFNKIKARNEPSTAPIASFYAGVIDFQREKYDSAKSYFEYTLDNSQDPKMDQQAENYIEQIANIKKYEELRKKKLILTLNLGLSYDSNILSVSPTSSSAPTELAGYRWSYGGSAEYRPIFSEHHEFSGILAVSDMYSTNSSFQANSNFQNTDPLLMNFSLPYKWKGEAFGKGAQVGLTPAYETIQMNADATGPRETILNSTILKADETLVMNQDWFANYSLEFRNDQSKIESADDDNQSATKITLATTQTFFQDQKKSKAYVGEANLAQNMANGKNQKSTKIEIAGSYLMPAKWETTFLSRLSLANTQYPEHTTGRSDTNIGLTLVLQKQINETWSSNFMATYNKNTSSLEGSTYDKYILMAGATWRGAF